MCKENTYKTKKILENKHGGEQWKELQVSIVGDNKVIKEDEK